MKIEVPDDLGKLSDRELDALEAQATDVLVSVRVHRRTVTKATHDLANRPAWAQTVYRLVDDKRSRFGIVIVIVAITVGSSAGQSCGVAGHQFKATQHALDVPPGTNP